jgi:hypothetical protein
VVLGSRDRGIAGSSRPRGEREVNEIGRGTEWEGAKQLTSETSREPKEQPRSNGGERKPRC